MMTKSKKQQEHLKNINEKSKLATIKIVERALQFMEDNHLDRTVSTLQRTTKRLEVDPEGKGRSRGTLDADYLQPLLKSYRIGKYVALEEDENTIDPSDYIKLTKEVKSLKKELKNKTNTIKKITKEKKKLVLENETLRHDVMELQTKLEISRNIIPVNNT